MEGTLGLALARAVLYLHFFVVVFNAGGLAVIALGGALGWPFVRRFWWRALHLGSLVIVAAQALLGRHCFLTLWQRAFERDGGQAVADQSWFDRWVYRAIYWPLPAEAFVALYVAALGLTVWLWYLVPPSRRAAS